MGHFGISWSYSSGNTCLSAGYPSDKENGEYLYKSTSTINSIDDCVIDSNNYCMPGQSGSPLYLPGGYAIGITSGNANDRSMFSVQLDNGITTWLNQNMKRIILSCLSLLMLFSMLTPWKTSAKSKSKLNKTSITMYTGTKVKLKLKGTKKKCKWSVNKPQIISVSQKGIVKAKKKGKAKVIAKIKKKKYICKVTVKVKKKQTDKSNSGNKSTPDTSANTNTNTNDSAVKSLTNLYIKNVLQNNTDTWILVNTKDSSGVTYSISYQSIGANVAITLNGKTVDKTALQKGDSLEIGYTGDLPDARKSWIPHLAYLKATRA